MERPSRRGGEDREGLGSGGTVVVFDEGEWRTRCDGLLRFDLGRGEEQVIEVVRGSWDVERLEADAARPIEFLVRGRSAVLPRQDLRADGSGRIHLRAALGPGLWLRVLDEAGEPLEWAQVLDGRGWPVGSLLSSDPHPGRAAPDVWTIEGVPPLWIPVERLGSGDWITAPGRSWRPLLRPDSDGPEQYEDPAVVLMPAGDLRVRLLGPPPLRGRLAVSRIEGDGEVRLLDRSWNGKDVLRIEKLAAGDHRVRLLDGGRELAADVVRLGAGSLEEAVLDSSGEDAPRGPVEVRGVLRVPRRFLADPDVEWSRVTLRFHRSGEDGALGPLAGHAALRTDPRSERASLGLEFSAVLQAGRYTAAVHPFGHLHSFELVQGAEELLIDVQELFRTTIRVDDLPGEGPPSLDAALDHGTHGRIRVGLVPHEPGGHRAVTVAGVLAIRAASPRGAVLEESLSVREDAEVVLRLDQRWSLRVTWEGPAMPDPGWWSGLRARSVVDAQARPPALRFRTRIGSADEVSAASWSFEQPGPFELLVPATGGSRLSSRIVPMEPGQRRYEVRLGGDG